MAGSGHQWACTSQSWPKQRPPWTSSLARMASPSSSSRASRPFRRASGRASARPPATWVRRRWTALDCRLPYKKLPRCGRRTPLQIQLVPTDGELTQQLGHAVDRGHGPRRRDGHARAPQDSLHPILSVRACTHWGPAAVRYAAGLPPARAIRTRTVPVGTRGMADRATAGCRRRAAAPSKDHRNHKTRRDGS